jgi:DNA-binding MarR family transcriptional regulator
MGDRSNNRTGRPGNGPISYEIGFLLRAAHQRAGAAFSTALQPLGIEGRHFAVLNQLDGQSHSQRRLVDLTGSDKASMVRLVDDLEAKGIVARNPAPGDRRVRAVTLTDHGTKVLAQARGIAREVAAALLTHMNPDDRDDLTRLLGEFLRGQHPTS